MHFNLKTLFFFVTIAAIVAVTFKVIYEVNHRVSVHYAQTKEPFEWLSEQKAAESQMVFGKEVEERFEMKVVAIIEGDTIETLGDDNEPILIRLEAIDTPEEKQAFGTKAKQAMADLVFGKTVTVLKTGEDRNGRTLAFVIADRVNTNEAMIKNGFAWHDKQYSIDETLADLEVEAREAKRGLWANPEPIAPWEFRKQTKSDLPK